MSEQPLTLAELRRMVNKWQAFSDDLPVCFRDPTTGMLREISKEVEDAYGKLVFVAVKSKEP